MAYFHKNLTQEKWNSYSRDKQILNIGAELMRARNWLAYNNDYKNNSLDRVYELIDLTVDDKKWNQAGLKELVRFREILGDYYLNEKNDINEFKSLVETLLKFTAESAKVKV